MAEGTDVVDTPEVPARVLMDDLFIDRNDLPTEWENHPQMYMYWAEEHTYAILDRDRQKDQLDLTFADLDGQIRNAPEEYKLTKVTDATVSAAIKRTELYQDEQERFHQANLVVNRMAAAKAAMDSKRRALDNMTTLLIHEHYNSNTGPAESTVNRGMKSQDRFTEAQKEKEKKQKRGLVD